MKKTILYRLFGIGKFPEHIAAQLKSEGILLIDEGVKGTATYKNFRAPWRYSNWKRQWYTGSIALTEVRLYGMQYAKTIVDVPLADERIRKINFSLEESDTLLIAFDASLFHDDWLGAIEYRFRTAQAQAFIDRLHQRNV